MKPHPPAPLQTAYKSLHPHSAWLPLSWKALTTDDWRNLLPDHPEFAPHCPWHRLDGYAWCMILMAQPQFADRSQWSRVNPQYWPLLLLRHPEFADKCPWAELAPLDWTFLLADHPQFADKCDWSKMRATCGRPFGDFWVALFKKQPQFLDRIDMDSLDIGSCIELLARYPEAAARFNRWDEIGPEAWVKDILPRQPQFADKCHCWDQFEGWNWGILLQQHPQFLSKYNLSEIGPGKWCWILGALPHLAAECTCWEDFDGRHWAALLGWRPEFAERCRHWNRLTAKDWVRLLLRRPQFADRCDKWSKISPRDWWLILELEPTFLDKCEVEPRWHGDEWPGLWIPAMSAGHPNPGLAWPLAEKYGWWSRVSGKMWTRLLRHYPALADKCDWTKLAPRDWFNLYDKPHAPALRAYCPEKILAHWRKRGFALKGRT